MPFRCVAGGCSNTPDAANNISLHKFPQDDDSRPQEKKRRKLWVNFVNTKRGKWTPTSRLCSAHFTDDDFVTAFGVPDTQFYNKRINLKETAVPTIHSLKHAIFTCPCITKFF